MVLELSIPYPIVTCAIGAKQVQSELSGFRFDS